MDSARVVSSAVMHKYVSRRTQAEVVTSICGTREEALISGLKNAKWFIRRMDLDLGRMEFALAPCGSKTFNIHIRPIFSDLRSLIPRGFNEN